MSKRIGILTGGGDAPGLNAVIRAIVKYGVGQKGWTVFGIEEAYNGLFKPSKTTWELTPDNIGGLLTKGGTILGTTNKGNPFTPDDTGEMPAPKIAQSVQRMNLDGLISIGGDGSQTIAHRMMQEYNIPIVGVPKTIDNDLFHTDYTFGFWSAVDVATDALDRLHTTAESHDRVMVLEVMGRTAGWIALYAGLSGGADCILIPEIPYDTSAIIHKIVERRGAGKHFTLIIVAEGAKSIEESQGQPNASGTSNKFVSGKASHKVATVIADHLDVECRVTVLGHLQRGGSPVAFDRFLATRFGIHAVDLIENGQWGEMVVLQNNRMKSIPLAQVAGTPREIPTDHELVQTARKAGISLGEGKT